MRRVGVPVVVVAAVLGLWSAPAAAKGNVEKIDEQVTGPYTGRQTFFSSPGCSFFRQVFTGTYRAERGTGSFEVTACVNAGGPRFTYDAGTFTVTTPKGRVLTGTVTGSTGAQAPLSDLVLVLTVTGGTKNLKHATGTITVAGTWANDPGVFGRGPTNGTLQGMLGRR